MPSTLAWLDHDAQARDRMDRVLALFEEHGTVDELGLGAVRDAFSDRLFPGTSTIQTRFRYFLFIPWAYRRLEEGEVPSGRIAEKGRALENRITDGLRGADDTTGVFGLEAGRRLKRLASSVYWGGLGEWGIRRFDGSRRRYHVAVDAIYRRRRKLGPRDEDGSGPSPALTWHPGLPDPPEGFPDELTLRLTPEEAEYLQDRVSVSRPDSLLAELFRRADPAEEASFPWEHPAWPDLGARHREVLVHARRYSEATQGASLLYNLMLAEKSGRKEKEEEYRKRLARWEAELVRGELEAWSLERLWQLTRGQGHTIAAGARRFVTRWVQLATGGTDLAGSREPRDLVRHQETRLKGSRSRFVNERSLDRWGGASGVDPFDYRWPVVNTYLRDLRDGLAGA